MRRSRVTKVVIMLLAVMMVFLFGCGSKSSAPDDPNIGVYVAKSASMSGITVGVEEVFEGGFTFELKNKGKAKCTFDNESGNLKWSHEGNKFHAEGEGAVFDGTIVDGVMVLENVMDSGLTLTLECDEIIALADKLKADEDAQAKTESIDENKDVPLAGEVNETGTESNADDSLYGRYEAVSASTNDGDVWIEAGEYLIVNEDGSVSMYVAEQNLDFDTTIENNKFYLNGDTKVGEINADGSITLNLNDEVKYTFTKEGSDLWNEWYEVKGAGSGGLGIGDLGAVDITGSSDEVAPVNYDFNEALKLVGDYEGFMVFKEGAHCYGRSFDGITGDAFARIVIDEKKQPLVYIRHIYGESINVEHVKGEFRDDGSLTLTGMMGTDDGPVEWMAILYSPVGNEPLCISAVLSSDYETPLFDFYMKPLGAKWDYSYVDDAITEKDFNIYVNNMGVCNTGLLEDELDVMQDFWTQNAKMDDPIKMKTDELPDPSLLHLYK